MLTGTLILVVVIALIFDMINGFHDTANAIATSVSTRVLTPRQAILMAACANFLGALVSESVAKTISKGLVNISVAEYVVIAALLAAIIWDLVTWYFGIPCSSSHALIGGLVGSSIVFGGSFKVIMWKGLLDKVIIPLFTSPVIGFFIGFVFMSLIYKILRPVPLNKINKWSAWLQRLSAAIMAFAHGSNDAQKSMGIITLAMVSAGMLSKDAGIPLWVKISCAIAMALGTSLGGKKIIRTIGQHMIKLQPIGGFAAETSAAVVIESMTAFGAPVSTTQVISSTIMGVGSAKRFSAVKWSVVKNILLTWVITLPATMLIGAGITYLIKLLVK